MATLRLFPIGPLADVVFGFAQRNKEKNGTKEWLLRDARFKSNYRVTKTECPTASAHLKNHNQLDRNEPE